MCDDRLYCNQYYTMRRTVSDKNVDFGCGFLIRAWAWVVVCCLSLTGVHQLPFLYVNQAAHRVVDFWASSFERTRYNTTWIVNFSRQLMLHTCSSPLQLLMTKLPQPCCRHMICVHTLLMKQRDEYISNYMIKSLIWSPFFQILCTVKSQQVPELVFPGAFPGTWEASQKKIAKNCCSKFNAWLYLLCQVPSHQAFKLCWNTQKHKIKCKSRQSLGQVM